MAVYATIALGLASTGEGGTFQVLQASGNAAYNYTVVGGLARADTPSLTGAGGAVIAAMRAAVAAAPPAISNLLVSGWALFAHEYDGRSVPNELAAAPPKFNITPDPFNSANETGGSTPTRTINDPTILDPDGNHNAMRITVTAQNQQNALTNINDDVLPTDDYTIRGMFQLESGGSGYRLGGVSVSTLSFTATASWVQQSLSLTAFANAVALGFSSAPGNATSQLGAYNLQLYDVKQTGTVFPSALDEKAALGFHAKRPSAYKGSLTIDQYGALDCTTTTDGALLVGPPDGATLTQFSMGCWINATAEPAGSSGNAFSFDFHTGGATNVSGGVGVTGNTATPDRIGMPFGNPNNSFLVAKTGQYLPGEGWQHLAVSVDNGVSTFYINGIPICTQTIPGYVNPAFVRLLLASTNNLTRRRKVLSHFLGQLQGWWFRQTPVTQTEIIQQDHHGRERLRLAGDPRIGSRRMALIGCGDSITADKASYYWHITQNRTISPRLHAHLEAVGGSDLGDWTADPRKAFLKQQIQAACNAGYTKVLTLHHAGTNEIEDWLNLTYKGTGGLTEWIVDYVAYIAELKAIDPRVLCGALTMVPRGTMSGVTNSGIYQSGALAAEQMRQTWNAYLRANYKSMGFDYLMDTGLGTERIDLNGNITAETIPGGTIRGNYRTAAGCVAYTLAPAGTLTLGALSGAAFPASCPAAPFTYQDVGRRVVGGTGSADIVAVAPDGTATLSTTGYTPTAYPNEPAASVTRDTITRTAFDALAYVSGAWSVQDAVSYQLNDGIHDSQPGGRLLADQIVGPAVATIQNTGAALAAAAAAAPSVTAALLTAIKMAASLSCAASVSGTLAPRLYADPNYTIAAVRVFSVSSTGRVFEVKP